MLASCSPLDILFSSERLDGLDEGGGMLMLGRSMVVFVCSVPACRPFLRIDEALVADSSVCELDL